MSPLRIAGAAAILGLAVIGAARGEPTKDAGGDAAAPWVELHASRARLVAGPTGTSGGARLAGLEIVLADGWKTYWRTPGDAGVPPSFDWAGSDNVASIKVLYPAPKRMPEAGGEVIGYKTAVLFPIEVTPKDATKPVVLKLAAEFGICREICVAANARFEAALPPGGTSAHSDAIAAALERVPRPHATRRPSDPELRKMLVDNGEAGARLVIAAAFPGVKGADAFVEAPDGLYMPLPRKQEQGVDGVVRYTVNLSADLARDLKGKTLTVTLVSETGATEARWTFP